MKVSPSQGERQHTAARLTLHGTRWADELGAAVTVRCNVLLPAGDCVVETDLATGSYALEVELVQVGHVLVGAALHLLEGLEALNVVIVTETTETPEHGDTLDSLGLLGPLVACKGVGCPVVHPVNGVLHPLHRLTAAETGLQEEKPLIIVHEIAHANTVKARLVAKLTLPYLKKLPPV